MRRLLPFLVFALAGCSSRPAPSRPPRAIVREQTSEASRPAAPPEAAVELPVAPRAQAKESPREGYCGETAIQEGLLLLGVYTSQTHVNRLGRPSHPDLYAGDLPVALRALGVRFTAFGGGGYGAFVAFAREALAAKKPVVAGVKILPTAHPAWGLDHFVLVVGEAKDGLVVDTTWGTREITNDRRTHGISLANAVYGLRLDGIALPPSAHPAHVAIVAEDDAHVALRVSCDAPARVELRSGPGEGPAIGTEDAPRGTAKVRVPRDGATYLRCVAP